MDSWAEISRLQARVSQLEQEKADVEGFAAMAAHELLTPVVMMDACAALIADRLDGDGDTETRGDLDAMRRGAARSRLLVETLLHHARAQDRPLVRRPVELGVMMSDCLRLLGPEIRARGARVVVGPLPTVTAEEELLHAVFMNLLVNALKYGPRCGGAIRVDATPNGAGWRFGVHSEGEPIPAEERERIFDLYRRGAGERRTRGNGIGLAVCRKIVERHGGAIGVQPGAHGGNRFVFTLPQK
jgi:signal transduction histidine kinase